MGYKFSGVTLQRELSQNTTPKVCNLPVFITVNIN